MKKWMKLLIVLCCICFSVQTVRADLIWEPPDLFYESHMDEMEYLAREYVANGPDGIVTVYKSPVNAEEIRTIENGTRLSIAWTYKAPNGEVWGYDADGWMPMAYMNVVYDYISFQEEFKEQIKSESGQLKELDEMVNIYGWRYPGSGEAEEIILTGTYRPEYDEIYVDETGKKWGYCTYYQGFRNFWIYLEDPTLDCDGLYGEETPALLIEEEEQNLDNQKEVVPSPGNSFKIIGIAIVAVVIVTAAVLWKMRHKVR